MLTALKLAHIIMPSFLAFVYVYFILLLNRYMYLNVILLGVFAALMLIYWLRTYALLHFRPGRPKDMHQYSQFDTDSIFVYKKNEERQRQLKSQMKNKKKHTVVDLKKEFIDLYQEPTFCDICECIKPPRSYHCKQCNSCILRRQKHSQLIQNCIGQGNLKVFVQYVFIAMLLSAYMTATLIAVTVGQHHQLNDFSDLQLTLFALEQMILCASLLLFIKEFSISYYNLTENITETERKQNILDKKNNPFEKEPIYNKLFGSKLQYLKVHHLGNFNQWLEMQEES